MCLLISIDQEIFVYLLVQSASISHFLRFNQHQFVFSMFTASTSHCSWLNLHSSFFKQLIHGKAASCSAFHLGTLQRPHFATEPWESLVYFREIIRNGRKIQVSEILFSNLPAHFDSNCRILCTILQHLGYMFDWFYQPFLVRRSFSSRSGWTCERSPCTRRRRSTGAWRRARRARRGMTRRSGSSATTEVEVWMDGWIELQLDGI